MTGLKEPLAAESLSNKAFERLMEAIDRGELAPGDRIREAALARQLGISRGPLREALRRLEGRKLVRYTPNLGMRVSLLSVKDLAEIFEIREALEGLACRLATERMSDDAIDELWRAIEERRRVRDAGEATVRPNDLDLHYRIVQGSGNERLIELLCNDLYYSIQFQRHLLAPRPHHASQAYDEHRDILSAMKDRNGDRADQLMRLHVRRSAERLTDRQAQINSAGAL